MNPSAVSNDQHSRVNNAFEARAANLPVNGRAFDPHEQRGGLGEEDLRRLGEGAAVFPGGSWYAVNGWLTWALGTLSPSVPGAARAAFDEFLRNTLAAHASAYPRHWNGTISVDDVCHAFYSPTPATCGIGVKTTIAGQIMHQPAWSLFDAIALAGVTSTAAGYRIEPRLPLPAFSLAPRPGNCVGFSVR